MSRFLIVAGQAERRRELGPYLLVLIMVTAVALQTRLMPFRPVTVESLPTTEVESGSAPLESVPPPSLPQADMPVAAQPALPMESAPPEAPPAADMTPPETVAPLLGGGSIGRIGALPHPGIAKPGTSGAGSFDRRAVMAKMLHAPFEIPKHNTTAAHKAEPGPLKPPERHAAAAKPSRPDLAPMALHNGLSGNAFTGHGRGPAAIGGPGSVTAGYGMALDGSDMRHKS
jgi:hypothetical protein